ncbi:MAG TPA: RHS repeat-associated core domain-containing protein [Verrucomicrobiae bacterium]|nr:RHS repeat-associated core domain-containing protein [Verrucomicrobiae bacterium]
MNGQSANAHVYQDGSFAATGFTPITGQNTYTAIAQDFYPRLSTNSVTVNVLGGSDYTYDLNGNLTSDGTRNFAYNDENELIAVWTTGGWSNSFAYDGLMRKRIEQQFAWNAGTSGWQLTNEAHYVYDGNLVLYPMRYENKALSQPVLKKCHRKPPRVIPVKLSHGAKERDGNNEPLSTYTRGVDLSGTLQGAGGIGGLLARSDNQKIVPAILTPANPAPGNLVTSYYFNDAQGNVTALVSPAGMLLAQYEYDPFGNLISKSGLMADVNKYQFSSKEWNGNAGLYYYGYRFYDPNLQRWVNRDPIQEAGGINLYGFVANNPINESDPYGLWGVQFGDFNIGWGNPNLAFDSQSWGDLGQGAAATTDGLLDAATFDGGFGLFDPGVFGRLGAYDKCDSTLRTSRHLGQLAGSLLDTAAALRGAARVGGTQFGRLLNSNRYFRIGPGRWGKDMVPHISIGNRVPGPWWSHWRL